ncbi:hypothetical protein KSC_106740 [Ktedonobacter sp. SOSP1-52]|nr:hypothetical protein KSC_106740 [Ktedonobacter sp. SOSP1-52]
MEWLWSPQAREAKKIRSVSIRKDLHEENRLSWNAATDAHNSHKADQAAFFRNGGNKLHAEQKALLGDIYTRVSLYAKLQTLRADGTRRGTLALSP